jgi:hypothetical protein
MGRPRSPGRFEKLEEFCGSRIPKDEKELLP